MAKPSGPLGGGKAKPVSRGMVGPEPARRAKNVVNQLKAAPGVIGHARDVAISSNKVTSGIRDVSRKAFGLPPVVKKDQLVRSPIKNSMSKPIEDSGLKPLPYANTNGPAKAAVEPKIARGTKSL